MTEQDNKDTEEVYKHIEEVKKHIKKYIDRNKLIGKPKEAKAFIKKIKEAV